MTTPVAEGTLLLHIGPQKTGSTAIQEAMHVARAQMAEHGVLYPGTGRRPIEAGWAVLGSGAPLGRPEPRIELWDELVRETRQTGLPRVCLSNEDLSRGNEAAVERIIGDLGAERLHVVFVARRLDKLLPSHWQERLKARMTWSYHDFLRHVLAEDDGSWEWQLMWESQDVELIIDRWARFVDRDQITVIASEEGNYGQLPTVFEELLGLPSGMLVAPDLINNRSYSFAEAEALRRINQVCADEEWPSARYLALVRMGLALQWTNSPKRPGDPRIPGLPAWAIDRVDQITDRHADAVAGAGVRVIGDPDGLRTRGSLTPDDAPGELDQLPADLLAQVFAATMASAQKRQAKALRAQQRRLAEAAPPEPSGRDLVRELGRRAAARVRRSGRS